MFHHGGTPGPMALLMIHGMWLFGAVVFAFGCGCLYVGIKQFINKWRRK